MSNAIVTVNGGTANLPTILGQGAPRLRTAGKIRAGIKVLTKNAANNHKAKEIYERGVQANAVFLCIAVDVQNSPPGFWTSTAGDGDRGLPVGAQRERCRAEARGMRTACDRVCREGQRMVSGSGCQRANRLRISLSDMCTFV